MEVKLYKISKYLLCTCLFYLLFFTYTIGENRIILYGTAGASIIIMIIDLLLGYMNPFEIFPFGVLMNAVMCMYSLLTGLIIAKDVGLVVHSLKTYLAFTLVCMVICYISYVEKDIEWLVNIIILINVVSSLYIVFQGYYFEGYGYVLGPEQNPNSLGLALDLGLFSVAYKSRSKNKKTFLNILIASLFFYIISGCGSRKCFIAAIVIILLWLPLVVIKTWQNNGWKERVLLSVLIVGLSFAMVYYFTHFYVNADSYARLRKLGTLDDGSSRLRIQYYKYALEFFNESPIFGIGFNQFRIWSPLHAYAHSTYAEGISDWGIVGCTLFFIPMIYAGICLILKILTNDKRFISIIAFALWCMELFLGIGQIWFFEFEHLVSWTIIYLILRYNENGVMKSRRKYKYVKV